MPSLSRPGALLATALIVVLASFAPAAEAQQPAQGPSGTLPAIGYNDDFNAFELVEPGGARPSLVPDVEELPVLTDLLPHEQGEPPIASTPKRAALIRRASEGGAQVIRYPIPWTRVERERGIYDWTTEDATYALALEAGLKPLIVLVTSPCWAHPAVPCEAGTRQVVSPDAGFVDEFGAFARAAAERYPEAVGFEIWNESNHPAYWGREPSPRAYGELLEQAWMSTRGVQPRPTVLYNGLTPTKGWKQYLRASYEEFGAGAFADATALHPYVGKRGPRRVHGQLRFARRTLRTAAVPARIWFTEFGWSTNPLARSSVGERAQAKRTLRIIEFARRARIEVAIVHRLIDIKHPTSAWESGLGASRLDGSPKPLFCDIARLQREPAPRGC